MAAKNDKVTAQDDIKTAGTTRRGLTKYKTNPFLQPVADKTQTRTRRISDTSGEKMMIVSRETGELVGVSGFWHTQEVDKSQFVKLYINGVKAFKELTGAGTKVFELLYVQVQQNIGRDIVNLVFAAINQEITPISERTFFRGIRELIEKGFIAETVQSGAYFVNPDYMWNGDRLAFVKDFRIRQSNQKDTLTQDMFDQLEQPK